MEYDLEMTIRSQLTSFLHAPQEIKKGVSECMLCFWDERGEFYSTAVLLNLDVKIQGSRQPSKEVASSSQTTWEVNVLPHSKCSVMHLSAINFLPECCEGKRTWNPTVL